MRKEAFCKVLGDIDEKYVKEADEAQKRRPVWHRWGTIAACLCLAAAVAAFAVLHRPATTPGVDQEPMSSQDGPSNLKVNGVVFYISPHVSVSDELPAGFTYAGEADVGGFPGCAYYVNPEMPEWVYVRHEVRTDGTLDATGTLTQTQPHMAYVRYVDERLRGRDLICRDGDYYISMWSAKVYGAAPDVSSASYDAVEREYGIRIEGDAPDGFFSVGTTEFSGYDTVPRGALSGNMGEHEVYANPDVPDIIFVRTTWYTAARDENGETTHHGFDVYIRYDCPLA